MRNATTLGTRRPAVLPLRTESTPPNCGATVRTSGEPQDQGESYGDAVRAAPSPLRRALPWLIDGGMALAFSVVAAVTVAFRIDDGYTGTAPIAASIVVSAVAPLALVLRRRRPLLCLLLVVLVRAIPQLFLDLDRPFIGGLVVVVVAFAACAQYAAKPWNWLAFVLPAALFAEYALLDRRFLSTSEVIFELVLYGIGWAIGTLFRVLAARNAALERELRAVSEAEALRRAARVAAEREHIAHELHDVIAHSVTAMVVQAGSARLQLPVEPAASAVALHQVEDTGREALAELRRALGLLRAEQDPDLPVGVR